MVRKMRTEKMTVNGVNYAYSKLNQWKPNQPVLICLHGFTGTMATFTFSISSFNLLGIDLIGHGKTDVFVHPYRYQLSSLVVDLAQLVKKLHIDSFYLLGYSMGARTALAWTIEQSEGILGVVLESGTPGIETASLKRQRQKKDNRLAQNIMTVPLSHFVEHWTALPLFESQKHLPLSVRKKIEKERLGQKRFGLAMSLWYMGTGKQKNYWPFLPYLQVPVLFLAGEYDWKFREIGRKLVTKNDRFEFVVVQESGHCIHIEQPSLFESVMSDWLKERKNEN